VLIMGQPVEQGRLALGYVPQIADFDRDFPISVWDVARMGRIGKRGLLRRYSAEDDALVVQALERVEMLDHRNRSIGDLSGGQRQRVYIARALAAQPQILLLDEPTASVDPEVRSSIYDLLRDLNDEMTILLVTHDLSAISTYVKTIGCVSRQLFYQGDKLITGDMIEEAYHCPVDLIAHGLPHRVLPDHEHVH
jgi:zinc transport system ATP-binding protein